MFEVYRPRSTTRPLTLNTDLFHDRCDVEYYPDEYVAPYPVEDYWMIGEKARMGAGEIAADFTAVFYINSAFNFTLSYRENHQRNRGSERSHSVSFAAAVW